MASTYSTNLAIELIGTGDQAGSWGNTTNTNLGTLIEQAISGYVTQAVSTGTDTTITIPNGATGVARNMYIELTGTGGASTNLIVPANKKLYFIFNNTSSGQVTVKVSGQTGVSVPNGKKMVLVSNGTDVVVAENYIADFGSNSATITNLTCTSLTLSNNPTFSGGTANGVLYLNGSKVATSGSALTFDGTDLSTTGGVRLNNAQYYYGKNAAGSAVRLLGINAGNVNYVGAIDNGPTEVNYGAASTITAQYWNISGSESMRLTSTGLGIGTASPVARLQVKTQTNANAAFQNSTSVAGGVKINCFNDAGSASSPFELDGSTLQFNIASVERMRLDSSGNLGIGTASPAQKLHVASAGNNYIVSSNTSGSTSALLLGSESGQNTIYSWTTVAGSTGRPLAFYTGASEAMRLDTSGNLFVGGTNGNARLTVRGSGTTSATASLEGATSGGATRFLVSDDGLCRWYGTSNSETMRLDNVGNLGIGTASPTSGFRLDVVGADFRVSDVASDDGVEIGWSAGGNSGFVQAYDRNASAFRNLVLNNAATIDSSGNLGLGVTPSAWGSVWKAQQLQVGAFVASQTNASDIIHIGTNAFANSSNLWTYINTAAATRYQQYQGAHSWFTAPSGTAGNTISFTQAMTLDANGVLLRGNTTARSTNALGAGQMQVEAANFSAFQMFANANSTDGSYMGLWKSRGGALGGTTIVQNGDLCGAIYFGGYDGTTAQPAAYIGAFVDGTPGASDMPGRLTFSTTADGSINPVERARITSGGYFKASNDGSYANSTAAYHELKTSAADYSAITSNSNASPYGAYFWFSAADPNNTTNLFLLCNGWNGSANATRATIRSNGGLANYQANNVDLSDARTKNNITPAASMWGKIGALEIVTYKYNDQTHDDVNLGVIAQQVESVEAAWVDNDGFGETPEGEEPLKTVYTKDIYFAAIKALQEAMSRIEQLEAKVAALESK